MFMVPLGDQLNRDVYSKHRMLYRCDGSTPVSVLQKRLTCSGIAKQIEKNPKRDKAHGHKQKKQPRSTH